MDQDFNPRPPEYGAGVNHATTMFDVGI